MLTKKGISVSPGVAIAKAVVLDAEDQPIPRRSVPATAVEAELNRLGQALDISQKEIEKLREVAEAKVGAKLAEIFGAHQRLLQDPQLTDQFTHVIRDERFTAEYAVYSVMREWAEKFEKLDNVYFRERAKDLADLERRLLSHLIGGVRTGLKELKSEAIVIARDLTPSQTAALDKNKVKALLTDAGGPTSHTAILAHALGIPAIVGLEDICGLITTGDQVIVDSTQPSGLVIVSPDAAQLMEYRQYQARLVQVESSLDETARLPAVTLDGIAVAVLANIEFPSEIPIALYKGAVGVGLFRTEFLYLAADQAPTEEQQYQAYKQALEYLGDLPLVIRTLDLGADKLAAVLDDSIRTGGENNPFLGVRSIRLCLANVQLFKTQLRAILRASVHGNLKIMFPLVSHIMELRQAKMVVGDVMEDLEDEGIAFRRDIPIGIMVEVPSAALQAKLFAREVAFFSIGTNDLIQYTLAVDRGNERLGSLYSGGHPAVLQLIKEVVRAATRAKIEVSLCGEMASDPVFVMLLLGLGLKCLSVAPPAIPEVKRIIRSVTQAQCQRVARKVLSFDSDREVLNYLHDQRNRVLPEVLPGRGSES